MAKAKKPKKQRASKYNEKLKVDASFDELMDVLFPSSGIKTETKKKGNSTKKNG